MSSTSEDTESAMTYPSTKQYARWKEHAEELDMSVREYIQAMIQTGSKKLTATVEPDVKVRELREQHNDLKMELDRAWSRIEILEKRLHHTERATCCEFVEDTPGEEFRDIVQAVVEFVQERLDFYLDALEGEQLRYEDGGYYPAGESAVDTGGES
ncbi:MAG: hypothetical protein ABEH64_03150 [Salinirussus sp.]